MKSMRLLMPFTLTSQPLTSTILGLAAAMGSSMPPRVMEEGERSCCSRLTPESELVSEKGPSRWPPTSPVAEEEPVRMDWRRSSVSFSQIGWKRYEKSDSFVFLSRFSRFVICG